MAAFIAPLVGGLLGGLGGLFGGGKQQQVTTNNNSTTNQSQQGSYQNQGYTTGSTTPNLSPTQQSMLASIMAGTQNQLKNATNLTGYTQQGLENINQGSQAASQAMAANLAGRGLSFSPAASTAQNQNTLNRIGQGNIFLSQVPLLQTQLQQQALQQLMQGFQIQPTGSSTTGNTVSAGTSAMSGTSNTTGTSTQTTTGNPTAGAIAGTGAGLFGGLSLNGMFPSLYGGSGPAAGSPNLLNTGWGANYGQP